VLESVKGCVKQELEENKRSKILREQKTYLEIDRIKVLKEKDDFEKNANAVNHKNATRSYE
jgi:hypothetical protein